MHPRENPSPRAKKLSYIVSSLLAYSLLPRINKTAESDDGVITHYIFLRQEPLEYISIACSDDGVVLMKSRAWGTSAEEITIPELTSKVKAALAETADGR